MRAAGDCKELWRHERNKQAMSVVADEENGPQVQRRKLVGQRELRRKPVGGGGTRRLGCIEMHDQGG